MNSNQAVHSNAFRQYGVQSSKTPVTVCKSIKDAKQQYNQKFTPDLSRTATVCVGGWREQWTEENSHKATVTDNIPGWAFKLAELAELFTSNFKPVPDPSNSPDVFQPPQSSQTLLKAHSPSWMTYSRTNGTHSNHNQVLWEDTTGLHRVELIHTAPTNDCIYCIDTVIGLNSSTAYCPFPSRKQEMPESGCSSLTTDQPLTLPFPINPQVFSLGLNPPL